jgi:hypothetical protein
VVVAAEPRAETEVGRAGGGFAIFGVVSRGSIGISSRE